MRHTAGAVLLIGVAAGGLWFVQGESTTPEDDTSAPPERDSISPNLLEGAAGGSQNTSPTNSRGSGVPGDLRRVGTCVVSRVLDGDTIDCEGGERIRLLLIDAPERDQGGLGARATRAAESLSGPGDSLAVFVDIEPRDRYGRLLAHVSTSGGVWVNLQLVEEGFAAVLSYPPNVRHLELFRAAARDARVNESGLWAVGLENCLPVDHRAGRC